VPRSGRSVACFWLAFAVFIGITALRVGALRQMLDVYLARGPVECGQPGPAGPCFEPCDQPDRLRSCDSSREHWHAYRVRAVWESWSYTLTASPGRRSVTNPMPSGCRSISSSPSRCSTISPISTVAVSPVGSQIQPPGLMSRSRRIRGRENLARTAPASRDMKKTTGARERTAAGLVLLDQTRLRTRAFTMGIESTNQAQG
jgi:hypothetical protein